MISSSKVKTLKKDDLAKEYIKLAQEFKILQKQLDNKNGANEANVPDIALSYRKENREGQMVYVAYVIKTNLDNVPVELEVVESTKDLALYKLEMQIAERFLTRQD